MKAYMIVVGLCLLACSWYSQDVQASSWITEKLSARLADEIDQLAPGLQKIDAYSMRKLKNKFWELGRNGKTMVPREPDADEVIQFVKSAFSSENQARNKLISVKSLAKTCNLHTLEVFAMLDLAMEKLKEIPLYVYRVVRDSHWMHAIECGPVYRQNYDRLFPSLEKDEQFQRDSELVHAALDELDIFDIGTPKGPADFYTPAYQRMYMFKMPEFKFAQDDLKAVQKIAAQIGKQLVKANQWDSKSLDDAHLKKALDEHLFEPCARFRNKQKGVLEPALILAEYEICKLGFEENPQFFRTVLDFGFCEKLLDEREQLYAKFFEVLRNTSAQSAP